MKRVNLINYIGTVVYIHSRGKNNTLIPIWGTIIRFLFVQTAYMLCTHLINFKFKFCVFCLCMMQSNNLNKVLAVNFKCELVSN